MEMRALECTVTAIALWFAADGIRATVAPLWKNLALLLGL